MKKLNQILLVADRARGPVPSGNAALSSSKATAQTGGKIADADSVTGTDKVFFPQMTIAMMQQMMTAMIVIAHIIIIIR